MTDQPEDAATFSHRPQPPPPPPTVVLAQLDHHFPGPIRVVHTHSIEFSPTTLAFLTIRINSLENLFMASFDKLNAKLEKVIKEVTDFKDSQAAKLATLTAERDALKAQLDAGGMTSEEEAVLEGKIEQIDALIEDATPTPIPPDPVEVATAAAEGRHRR